MKLAFLGPAPPIRGGISSFALKLAETLLQDGHEVKMFGFQRQYPSLIFPGKAQTTEFELPAGLQIENAFVAYRPDTWPKALKSIRAFEPDILIISYFIPFFAPLYWYVSKSFKDIKIKVILHNLVPHERWPAAKLLARAVLSQTSEIICLSTAIMNELKALMPNMIYLKAKQGFHPVYDQYQAQEPIVREAHSLLFFGLIKKYKGLDILLKAMPEVLARFPDARLVVAGEVYGDDSYYQELIQSLNIQANVETQFRYVQDAEIASFFKRSSLCVLPYRSASQSGVIATCMAFGLPVLASNFAGLAQYIEDGVNGILVEAKPEPTPQDLAAKIIHYFQSNGFQAMSAAQSKKAQSYSWDKLAEILIN